MRLKTSYGELLPVEVERAKSLEPNPAERSGRFQMNETRNQFRLVVVMRLKLAGKPPKKIPVDLHTIVRGPAQKIDVLRGTNAFAHQSKNGRVQRLEPGLEFANAGSAQGFDLLSCQVALDLEKEIVIRFLFDQGRYELAQEIGGHDVVGGTEVSGAIFAVQFSEFRENAFCLLLAEVHRCPIEAAEGAMMLLAPPTPARCFEEQSELAPGIDCKFSGAFEELTIVGDGKIIEFSEHAAAGGTSRSREDAWNIVGRTRLGDRGQKSRECFVAITFDRIVDPRAGANDFATHLSIEIRAAEQDEKIGMPFLESASKGQGGGVLLERRGEPNDGVARPIDDGFRKAEVGRHAFVPQAMQRACVQSMGTQQLLNFGIFCEETSFEIDGLVTERV